MVYHDKERYAKLLTKEVLHRAEVIDKAQKRLDDCQGDPEKRLRCRTQIVDQAKHYQKLYNGLLKVALDDELKDADL